MENFSSEKARQLARAKATAHIKDFEQRLKQYGWDRSSGSDVTVLWPFTGQRGGKTNGGRVIGKTTFKIEGGKK